MYRNTLPADQLSRTPDSVGRALERRTTVFKTPESVEAKPQDLSPTNHVVVETDLIVSPTIGQAYIPKSEQEGVVQQAPITVSAGTPSKQETVEPTSSYAKNPPAEDPLPQNPSTFKSADGGSDLSAINAAQPSPQIVAFENTPPTKAIVQPGDGSGAIPIPVQGGMVSPFYYDRPEWSTDIVAEHILREGKLWDADKSGNVVVTFSFPDTIPTDDGYEYLLDYEASTDPFYLHDEIEPFSDAQKEATRQIFQLWSEVANITFVEETNPLDGQIRLFNSEVMIQIPGVGQAGGRAEFPGGGIGGDVWINNLHPDYEDNLDPGEFGYFTIMHEIGHALGLHHSGEYDADVPVTYATGAEFRHDSIQYSVMSYFGSAETGAVHYGNLAATPLLFDIAAIQKAYGTNFNTRVGDTVYGTNSNAGNPDFSVNVYDLADNPDPVYTVWDAGGVDTFDFSSAGADQFIDLHNGSFSDVDGLVGNVSINGGTIIENAVGGSGDDVLIGNAFDNELRGGKGEDLIFGSDEKRDFFDNAETFADADQDRLYGGEGDDTISGRWGDDEIWGDEGKDRLDGDAGEDVIWGGLNADFIVGGKGEDILSGDEGDDILYGHLSDPDNPDDPAAIYLDADQIYGGDGDDTIFGSFGDDILFGDSTAYNVIGTETADPTDRSTGSDTIYGGEGDDRIYGEREADFLYGNAGNDRLFGGNGDDDMRGGEGDDELTAGRGNDWMVGELGFDDFDGGQGVDTVSFAYSDLNWSIDLQDEIAVSDEFIAPVGEKGERIVNVENIEGGSGMDQIFGSSVDNMLRGGGDRDMLIGRAGNDSLFGDADDDEIMGGEGDDFIDAGSGNDIVGGGNGIDTLSYEWDGSGMVVDLTAPTNQATGVSIGIDQISGIENVIGGTGGDFLQGNDVANSLYGGMGDDKVFGMAGDDTLSGGQGLNSIDGGDGVDVAIYDARIVEFTITDFGNGSVSVSYNGPETWVDDLVGVEILSFTDGDYMV